MQPLIVAEGTRRGCSTACDIIIAIGGLLGRLPLSLTHRFSAALADASGRFVLKNPGQIRKTVRGRPSDVERPITLIRTDAATSAMGLRRALALAQGEARATGGRSSVLLLGRYRNDEPATVAGLQRDHPELAISFSTIHRAKVRAQTSHAEPLLDLSHSPPNRQSTVGIWSVVAQPPRR